MTVEMDRYFNVHVRSLFQYAGGDGFAPVLRGNSKIDFLDQFVSNTEGYPWNGRSVWHCRNSLWLTDIFAAVVENAIINIFKNCLETVNSQRYCKCIL